MSKTILTAIIGVITLNSCTPQEDSIWMKIKDVYCEQVYCSSSIFETVFLGIICFLLMSLPFHLIIEDLTTKKEKYRILFKDNYLSREEIGFSERYQGLSVGVSSLVCALYFWIEGEYKDLAASFFVGLVCGFFLSFFLEVVYVSFLRDTLEEPFKKIKTYIVRRIFKNKRKLNIKDLEAEMPQFREKHLAKEIAEEDIYPMVPATEEEKAAAKEAVKKAEERLAEAFSKGFKDQNADSSQ